MRNECLIIIDPQKDFINQDGVYAKKHPGINQILQAKQNINQLLSTSIKNIIVVYSNYRPSQFAENVSMCLPNTFGHQLDIELNDNSLLFAKTEHSCFSSFEFVEYLKENKIDKIIITGFLAEYCVKNTAIDALKKGFSVSLLKGCIGTGDDVQERLTEIYEQLSMLGAEII
jgi:nicotinamidase/pyrazinamidase